jgi:hypothetical protein
VGHLAATLGPTLHPALQREGECIALVPPNLQHNRMCTLCCEWTIKESKEIEFNKRKMKNAKRNEKTREGGREGGGGSSHRMAGSFADVPECEEVRQRRAYVGTMQHTHHVMLDTLGPVHTQSRGHVSMPMGELVTTRPPNGAAKGSSSATTMMSTLEIGNGTNPLGSTAKRASGARTSSSTRTTGFCESCESNEQRRTSRRENVATKFT